MNIWGHYAANRQRGFVLLPVILLITLTASVIFLLTRENASSLSVGVSEAERTEASYIAAAGVQHALASARQANCSNYSGITNEPFGDHSYSVVVSPTDGSPVTFQSTAALASGANMTIQRSATTVYSAASMQLVTLQPGAEGEDAEIWDQSPNNNYGNSAETWVSSASNDTTRSLLRFDMGAIPAAATVLEATLSLLRQSGSGANQPVSAHRIMNQWSEDSVTWNSRESGTNWDTAGSDFENMAIATTPVGPGNSRYEWNIAPLVQGWVDGSYANHGVALVAAIAGMSGHRFHTSDETGAGLRPSLSVTYACECGVVCAPSGTLPIAHWKLDDASGVNAEDSVGGNDGTLTNGPSWVAGSTNGALSFDESDDFVRVPDMSYGPEFSVSFDINVADNSGSLFQYIYSHGDINSTNSLNIFLVEGSHGTDPDVLRTVIRDADDTLDNSALEFDISAIVGDGNWHTYTLTVENGVGAKVYLDGVLQNSDSRGGDDFDPTGDVFFGARQDLDPNRLYGGLVDEVRIYNTALDATEVADLATGPGTATTWETRIADTDDDAEQRIGDGYMDLSSSDLELALDVDGSQTNLAGMLFAKVAVPHGATINNAYIQFQVDEERSGDAKLSIIGQNVDGAEKFKTTDFDISDRARTAASVPWAVPPWNTVGEAGSDQQTPDIAPIIQEIVNRPGWSSDNDLVLMILGSGTRTAESYDGDPNGAPLLHIEYSGGGDNPFLDGVAHWMLDETSGITALDSVGGHDGELINGPTWTAGQINGGLEFDGNNDYIRVSDSGDFHLTDGTIHVWINADNIAGEHYLFHKSGSERIFVLIKSGEITFETNGDTLTSSIQADQWYMVTISFGLEGMKLYLDDSLVGSNNKTDGMADNNDDIYIGNDNTLGKGFDGTMDDIRIYDKALSAAEIADLFATGSGGGGSCDGKYRDQFDEISFAGSDGDYDWTGPWLEVGESNGPSSGDIRVMNDTNDYQLRIRDNDNGGEGVERELDLSGAGSATLSYDYRRMNLDTSSDYVAVEISGNGASGPWDELGRHAQNNDADYLSVEHDISDYTSVNTRIRFVSSSTMGGTDTVWFDDVRIDCNP